MTDLCLFIYLSTALDVSEKERLALVDQVERMTRELQSHQQGMVEEKKALEGRIAELSSSQQEKASEGLGKEEMERLKTQVCNVPCVSPYLSSSSFTHIPIYLSTDQQVGTRAIGWTRRFCPFEWGSERS